VNARDIAWDGGREYVNGGATVELSSLVGIEEAAGWCNLSVESLRGWVESGHAPHYFIDGNGPLFRRKELAEWVKANLVQFKAGMPIPRRIDILCAMGPSCPSAPPLALANIGGLCLLSLGGMVTGIYFLCKDDQVVYVGQSNRVVARIASHIGEGRKDFDHERVYFLPCPLASLNELERRYIDLLKPRYNGNRGGSYRHGPNAERHADAVDLLN
jgi:hypothetical protein